MLFGNIQVFPNFFIIWTMPHLFNFKKNTFLHGFAGKKWKTLVILLQFLSRNYIPSYSTNRKVLLILAQLYQHWALPVFEKKSQKEILFSLLLIRLNIYMFVVHFYFGNCLFKTQFLFFWPHQKWKKRCSQRWLY